MTWEVFLSADESILLALSRALEGQDPRITRVGNGFALQAKAFDTLSDADEVRKSADGIVTALSGAAAVLLSSHAPICVSHIEHVGQVGTRNIIIQPEPATVRVSAHLGAMIITRADGTVVEEHRPADPAPRWLAAALRNELVAKALRLRTAGDLDWAGLYRLLEVIEEGTGGLDQIIARGWATRGQIRSFKHTANSVGAVGDQARHGMEITDPPPKPMKLSTARSLIDGVLTQWLNSF